MNSTKTETPSPNPGALVWRKITRDDLSLLVDLANECFRTDGGLYFLFDPNEIASRFFPDEPGTAIGLLASGRQLVACNAIRVSSGPGQRHGTISGFVHPEHRNRGIGAALIRWSLSEARSLIAGQADGSQVLQIRSESLTESARRLYKKFGFQPTMEELVMRRDLASPLPEPGLLPGVTIMDWRPELAGQFYQAWNAAFRERPGFPGYKTAAEWVESWTTNHFRPDWSMVAHENDEPLGFVMGTDDPPHGYIMHVGVIPTQRRRGLASGLMLEVMRRMQAAGAPSAQLCVNINNPGAIKSYVNLGFETIGRRAKFEKMFDP